MNSGKWNGKQLIPKALVADALAEHITVAPKDSVGDMVGYGYQVWRFSFIESGRHEQLVQMSGNGGQFVSLNDNDKMLVVITAGNFDRVVKKSSFDFYMDNIYPAVLGRR